MKPRYPTPPLVTARLILAPLDPADADEMVEVLGDATLYAYIGGAPPTLDELRHRYRRLAAGRSADGTEEWHNWAVRRRDDGVAVGTLQATIMPLRDAADIAWVIGRAWQGQGYATEGARALVGWLEGRGIGTITAHVHPENRASIGVAGGCGLEVTDLVEDGEQVWARREPGRTAAAPAPPEP